MVHLVNFLVILILLGSVQSIRTFRNRWASTARHTAPLSSPQPAPLMLSPPASSQPSSPLSASNSSPSHHDGSSRSGTSSADAGIVFPKSVLQSTPGLEEKMILLTNVTRAEDFFRILGVEFPGTENTGYSGYSITPMTRTRQARPLRPVMTEQAMCEPEMRTIDLSNYSKTSVDPDTVAYPHCIRVPRCGGCCGPSGLFECLPIKQTIRDVPRYVQKLTARSQDSKSMIQEIVKVEYHESCACQCRIQEKDCDLSTHVYDKSMCKCMCPSAADAEACLAHAGKIWNPLDCTCRCRHTKHCSTGLKFSHSSCSCQMEES